MSREIPGERASSSFCGDVGEGSWASGFYFLLTSDFSTVAIKLFLYFLKLQCCFQQVPITATTFLRPCISTEALLGLGYYCWFTVHFQLVSGLAFLPLPSYPFCVTFSITPKLHIRVWLCWLCCFALLFCEQNNRLWPLCSFSDQCFEAFLGVQEDLSFLEMTMFPKSVCVCLSQGESLWPKATQKPMLL